MTSHVTVTQFLLTASRRSLLSKSFSIVSAVAILSGGTVWAQSADQAPEPASEGTAPSALEPSPTLSPPTTANRPIVPTAAPERFPTVETPLSITPKPTASSAATDIDQGYIDSTKYTIGATERSSDLAKRPQLPNITLPKAGAIANGDYSYTFAAGRTTPSVKDYYYRTLRPPAMLGNGNIRLIFPLSIPAPITSLFGWRIHPITGEQLFHSGTDLGAPLGTPVLAAYAGRVVLADFLGGYGLAVALEHNKGTQQTLYGHMSEIFVKPGEWVKQGMVIGRVGSTGLSTGPHLHFEFRQLTPEGWVAMDPGAQLEYALAQLVKSFDFAHAKPGEFPGLDGSLGAVNLGAKGDITLQIEELKQLSRQEQVSRQQNLNNQG